MQPETDLDLPFAREIDIGRQVINSVGRPQLVKLWVCVTLGVAFVLYLIGLNPDRFANNYDSAVYVTSAKALATGQGYRLISLPDERVQTLVPPFYPFLLSLIWRMSPGFPQNLTLMALLSALAVLGFLAMTWVYLHQHGYASEWTALLTVALVAANWQMLFWATSMVAEPVYALLSVAGLYLAEKFEKAERPYALGLTLGVILGLVFLTRTAGIALLLSVAAYYVLRRQWRRGWVPICIGGVFVAGWLAWCFFNQPIASGQVNADYYTNYVDGISASMNNLRTVNNASLFATVFNIVSTNIVLFLSATPPLLLGLRYDLPQLILLPLVLLVCLVLVAGFLRQVGKGVRLLEIYICVHFAIHLPLPAPAFTRYLVPIMPFLLLYLLNESRSLMTLIRKHLTAQAVFNKLGAALLGILVLVSVSLALYCDASGLYSTITLPRNNVNGIAAHSQNFEWINAHTSSSDVLVCYHDPFYYLYTGRKAIRSFPVSVFDTVMYQTRPPDLEQQTRIFDQMVKQNSGRYLILNSNDFGWESEVFRTNLESYTEEHRYELPVVFRSTDGRSAIFQIKKLGE